MFGFDFKSGDIMSVKIEASKDERSWTDITKYVKNASIVYDWDSDTKMSGSIEIQGLDVRNFLYRFIDITISAKRLNSNPYTRFHVGSIDLDYEDGQWSGTIGLESLTAALKNQKVRKNSLSSWYLPIDGKKYWGNTVKGLFMIALHGAPVSYTIKSGVANEKIDVSSVKEDEDMFSILRLCEGETGKNAISIERYGEIILMPAPTSKSSIYKKITAGESSCIFPGLTTTRDDYEVVNRVTCFSNTLDKSGSVNVTKLHNSKTATLPSSSKYSKSKTGRWVDYVDIDSNTSSSKYPTSVQLQKKANRILREQSKKAGNEYTFSSMLVDTPIGKNIQLKMDKVTVNGLCVRVEISIDPSTGCAPIQTTTLREW